MTKTKTPPYDLTGIVIRVFFSLSIFGFSIGLPAQTTLIDSLQQLLEKSEALINLKESSQVAPQTHYEELQLKAALDLGLVYETEKNYDAIIRQQKYLNWALGSIGLLSFLLLAVFIGALKQKSKSHKLLENRVAERTAALKRSNKRLKRSLLEQERFAHIASHDLKEPLRNISSFSKLLEKQLKFPAHTKESEYPSFILRGAQQMYALIENLQEFSNLQNVAEIETVNLDQIVDLWKNGKAAENFPQLAITLIKKKPFPMLRGHQTHFQLLFKNLIENAIFYNDKELKIVEFDVVEESEALVFSIRDNGIGIESNYYLQIFEMFKRLHHRGEHGGAGLGLAICQKVVDNLGGRIWVESVKGQGSSFYFSLPSSLKVPSVYSDKIVKLV